MLDELKTAKQNQQDAFFCFSLGQTNPTNLSRQFSAKSKFKTPFHPECPFNSRMNGYDEPSYAEASCAEQNIKK